MPEVSIVIPVYNSEQILPELARQMAVSLRDYEYELILVNDHSPDGSWNAIARLARQDHRIVGINLRKNAGQDNAIMAGLREARGDFVVIMDDDLQHSPSDIPRLYEKCREGYDICYANFARKHQTWWKNLGSWLNGRLATITLGKPKHIYLSPFQIVRREIVREVIRYQRPFPYVQGLLLSISDNVAQVDVEHHPRHSGRGGFNLAKSMAFFFRMATGYSVVPLRLAAIVGCLIAVSGFILGIFYLSEYLFGTSPIEGWTTTICLDLFVRGFIMMSLGLIGEYIGRIYLTVSGSPQYTVLDTVDRRDLRHQPEQVGVTSETV